MENGLREEKVRLGAQWATATTDQANAAPVHYGDAVRERDAVRDGCGIIDLSERGRLRITGPDRLTFLQGMVSNDTRELLPGRGIYATVLNPKGHLLGDATLYAFDECILADTEAGRAGSLAKNLNRYRIREKVVIVEDPEDTVLLGLSGPASWLMLRERFAALPIIDGPFGCAEGEWEGSRISIMRRDFTGEDSFLLRAPSAVSLSLWRSFVRAGVVPFGTDAAHRLRVEAGIPVFGIDMTEEQIPLEAGVHYGISRDKGCYIGQEVVERIASRGHVNRRLLPVRFGPGPVPEPGNQLIRNGENAGWVTSAVAVPSKGYNRRSGDEDSVTPADTGGVGLAYVRREARESGSRLTVAGLPVEATILRRPVFGSGNPPAIVAEDPA